MTEKLHRRQFIAGTSAAIAFPSVILSCSAKESAPLQRGKKSLVAIARQPGVLQPQNSLKTSAVAHLLDESMRAIGETKQPLDSWKRLFGKDDTVGIKINTLGGRMLSPHPELVEIIAQRLVEAGVSPRRILIWDRMESELQRAGFPPGKFKEKGIVIGTDHEQIGYEREPSMSGSIGSCFSRIISHVCTALINVGILKDHDLSGTSVAMKNLFGLIHNPNRYHFDVNKDPYLPDLCLHPYVKNKLRLTVCDAFRGQYDGGPAYKSSRTWDFDGILVSRDQVALDAVAAEILAEERKKRNLKSLKEENREPLYIQLAEEKKLGWADMAKINKKEIT